MPVQESEHEVVVYCDGGYRTSDGQIAYAAVAGDRDGRVVGEWVRNGRPGTSNQAEYHGLCLGVALAHLLGARVAHFRLDSDLVVQQVGGWWTINDVDLKQLHSVASSSLMRLDRFTIKHVPRGQNRRADWLVCRALGHARTLKNEPVRAVEFSDDGLSRPGWSTL